MCSAKEKEYSFNDSIIARRNSSDDTRFVTLVVRVMQRSYTYLAEMCEVTLDRIIGESRDFVRSAISYSNYVFKDLLEVGEIYEGNRACT